MSKCNYCGKTMYREYSNCFNENCSDYCRISDEKLTVEKLLIIIQELALRVTELEATND